VGHFPVPRCNAKAKHLHMLFRSELAAAFHMPTAEMFYAGR